LEEKDLARAFNPRTVAVVGVSTTNMFHPANIIYNKNFYGYDCEVFAVNPKGGEIDKRPVYRSLAEVPEKVEMAVVAVKARVVPDVARECADAGVETMVVISGGFAEMGPEGRELQDRLVEICEKASITLIGPNCFGVYAPPAVDTFFLPPERTVLPVMGRTAVASQSGAFLVDQIMTSFHEVGLGLSVAVSMGNKAMVSEEDLLLHFAARDDTDTLCFYIEGIDEGVRRFIESAREVTPDKPIEVSHGGAGGGPRAGPGGAQAERHPRGRDRVRGDVVLQDTLLLQAPAAPLQRRDNLFERRARRGRVRPRRRRGHQHPAVLIAAAQGTPVPAGSDHPGHRLGLQPGRPHRQCLGPRLRALAGLPAGPG
jgi:succinyl-CoA synthetase alpha subunit